MTTTATAPPGQVVCPTCEGKGKDAKFMRALDWYRGKRGSSEISTDCTDCNGTGYIPDPIRTAYYGDSPAAFVRLCVQRPRDDAGLRVWKAECIKLCNCGDTVEVRHDNQDYLTRLDIDQFLRSTDTLTKCPARIAQAPILRSVFAPPWLCGVKECPKCEWAHADQFRCAIDCVVVATCEYCHGTGSIRIPPMFDARWGTSTVKDIAKGIQEGEPCGRCNECIGGTEGKCCHRTPRFDRMPILADALMDAGCDSEEMIDHARSGGPYVASADWLLALADGAGGV